MASSTKKSILMDLDHHSTLQSLRERRAFHDQMRVLHELLIQHHCRRGDLYGKRKHEEHAAEAACQVHRSDIQTEEMVGREGNEQR